MNTINQKENQQLEFADENIEQRKADHIGLAFQSAVSTKELDRRFHYEPLFSGTCVEQTKISKAFDQKILQAPIWVSSMTGGTEKARIINQNLARACKEFGLGMGLGSCRQLLDSEERFEDFNIRPLMGDQPLYANIGVAQLEELIALKAIDKLERMVEKLDADGLIIHINPLQEWMQPEGDIIKRPPIESIAHLIEESDLSLIVKEVGQGMGKASLSQLLKLPIVAIEFGANGGTNFSKLELLRADEVRKEVFCPVINLGHSAHDMVLWCNELHAELGEKLLCKQLIISGGIKSFLDGYFLVEQSKVPAIYAQASGFLKYATSDYERLKGYVEMQIEGYKMAKNFLRINESFNGR